MQVSIPENTDAGTIGDLLAEKGVVASGGFFELNATLTGRRGKLRPGEYTLTQDMSYGDAIAALEKGPKVKVVPTVNVTVPEGLSIREAAPVVDKGPLKGSYRKAASERRVLRRIRRLGAPRGTRHRRGLHVPGHLHAGRRQPGARPGEQAARRVRGQLQGPSTCATPSART